ncbi:MAG: tyrosine-type recombinase/integrase [Psychrobacillus sp.]
MPIQKSDGSPLDNVRTELQVILNNYGPSLLEQVVNEIGLTKVEANTTKIQNVTLAEAIEYYLCSSFFLGLSESSKKTYASELNQFKFYVIKECGENTKLQEAAEPMLLVKYLLPYNYSNTKTKKSAFLRSFFRCVFKEYQDKDISDIKDVLKLKWTNDNLPRALTKVQLAEIICLSQLFSNELRNYTILWVFLGSGIRLNELINLKISDIDVDNKTIKVIPKKYEENKRPRKISKVALLILSDYIKFKYDYNKRSLTDTEFKNLYVFSTDNGRTAINRRTVQHMMTKLITAATTIPKSEKNRYSVHTLRHCFAIYGLEAGIDIYTLSKLLGHESINSTTVYLKLFDDQLEKAIEKHPLAQMEKINIQKRISDEL